MKYLITYKYDKWNEDDCVGVELCNTDTEVEITISDIKFGMCDQGQYQRNIKVYKAEEVTEEFDTKTEFDDEKD